MSLSERGYLTSRSLPTVDGNPLLVEQQFQRFAGLWRNDLELVRMEIELIMHRECAAVQYALRPWYVKVWDALKRWHRGNLSTRI